MISDEQSAEVPKSQWKISSSFPQRQDVMWKRRDTMMIMQLWYSFLWYRQRRRHYWPKWYSVRWYCRRFLIFDGNSDIAASHSFPGTQFLFIPQLLNSRKCCFCKSTLQTIPGFIRWGNSPQLTAHQSPLLPMWYKPIHTESCNNKFIQTEKHPCSVCSWMAISMPLQKKDWSCSSSDGDGDGGVGVWKGWGAKNRPQLTFSLTQQCLDTYHLLLHITNRYLMNALNTGRGTRACNYVQFFIATAAGWQQRFAPG